MALDLAIAVEVSRVIEFNSRLYAEQATSSYEKARYLESILEKTKPPLTADGWPALIASPFRYPLPVAPPYQARFRPPFFAKNVLYASRELRTALYEHAYHFLKERVHFNGVRDTGQRTAFSLFILTTEIEDLKKDRNWEEIMSRRDYGPSHAYTASHPDLQVLSYPSCRDPQHGDNFAIFDIRCLARHLGSQLTLSFYFDPEQAAILWMDQHLRILWKDVC